MQFRAKQIAPPKEWGIFEDLCHALFKRVWQDPLAQKNGRRGQAQNGVDIFGSLQGVRSSFCAVQCKGKDRNYGHRAEWAEVLAEVSKAETFSPKLDGWIFATTAATDAVLQKEARALSIERKAKGLFSVDVLGWEEIQALLATAPEVIAEFYPEHADHMHEVISALRALPALEVRLTNLAERMDSTAQSSRPGRPAIWEKLTFEADRGLGPALMGYPLGPSDAAACPRLAEVAEVLLRLDTAFSARLVGEPGSGKSICSYQVAMDLVRAGYEVLRLLDPQTDLITLDAAVPGKPHLYLIDDAHLLRPQVLTRLEEQADSSRLVLSTHNAVEHVSHRGGIALDAKRAVKTIAAALRADLPRTLEVVRRADDDIGERMMFTDLGQRLDQAESADRPWQFCFVLGGGWRRSKQAADSARLAGADLVLAAVAARQLVSRDARALPGEIEQVCRRIDINATTVNRCLTWLAVQRLVVGTTDCRTPHQRFASVVLKRILEGQSREGREQIAGMIEGVLCDPQFPYAGVRVLVHELRFGSGNFNWTRLLGQAGVRAVVDRCWAAEGADRGSAALALSDLYAFAEGGAPAVMERHVATLASWISRPADGAYGFGFILNDLAQPDRDLAARVVSAADPVAIAKACSDANPDTAYGLADLMRSIAYIDVEAFNTKLRDALDRDKLRLFAQHEAFLKDAFIFGRFCASISGWDQALALEMAELFIPTAQRLLAEDPLEGFSQISHDFASTVLRVFDVLHIYVGKWKASPRQWAIARSMCERIDPASAARHISSVRLRHLQSASYFLHFLELAAPRKFEATLRHLDWEALDASIHDEWADMSHETEVLLAVLYSRPKTRSLVQSFIAERIDRIVHFPPRLMLMAPEVGFSHVTRGGMLRLAAYNHMSWDYGGLALAVLAQARPELVEQAVMPFVDTLAQSLTAYSRNFTGPAEGLVRTIIDHAPTAWSETLAKMDWAAAEKNLAECLAGDRDHQRTAAIVIESAVTLNGACGDTARRLRKRFPTASIASTDVPQFRGRRRRLSRKRPKQA